MRTASLALAALAITTNSRPAKPVKVFHATTNVEMQFNAEVGAEYAVAYAYCEENHRLSELFSHRDDDQLPAMYGKLPMTYGKQSVGCGDWMAASARH